MNYLIKNATIVNEGLEFCGNVLISDGIINKVYAENENIETNDAIVIDASGKYLIPGIIDEHVHFREPGMTAKADIYSESKAAVAGGVTSFMEMPNTIPQTTTTELFNQKFDIASNKSLANFSFYIGATNDNLNEIMNIDPNIVCGIKLFMGSSTGNMLVDKDEILQELFRNAPCLIAAHCEDEDIIKENTQFFKNLVSQGKISPDATLHPKIRTEEACYRSTCKAIELATKTNAKLHIMHISTQKEMGLFENIPLSQKKITAETCPHYLFFDDAQYSTKGFAIKCNPAIKTRKDREYLLSSVNNGTIDTIGSDHAPHLWEEKFTDDYFTAKSGFPSIQTNLDVMLNLKNQGYFTLSKIVQLMCHNPAILYQIDRRGFVREGYYADLVIVDCNSKNEISKEDVYYKCKWTPYDGTITHSRVTHTFVNGNLVYENGCFHEESRGRSLTFNRA